jgi:hypothetical protein
MTTTKSPSVKVALAALEYFAKNEKNYDKFVEHMTVEWSTMAAQRWRFEGAQVKHPQYRNSTELEVTWRREGRVMVESIVLVGGLHYGGAWSGQHA